MAPDVAYLPPRCTNGMGTVYGEGAGCGLRNAHVKIVELFCKKQKNFKYAMIASEENLGSMHPIQPYVLECLLPKPLTSKQVESMKKIKSESEINSYLRSGNT